MHAVGLLIYIVWACEGVILLHAITHYRATTWRQLGRALLADHRMPRARARSRRLK